MDRQQDEAWATTVYERRGEAVLVPCEKVSLGDRDPARGECHRNVDAWIALHSENGAVRGWFYEEQTMSGTAKFHAHSVIDRRGELVDITCPDAGIPFIRHVGTEGEFMRIANSKPPELRHVYDRAARETYDSALRLSVQVGSVNAEDVPEFY
jgi:hypothetical protein